MSGQTLEEAREWLRKRVNSGEHCPCCTQYAKVYRRKITGSMARSLIALYRAGAADEYVYAPALLPKLGGPHHGGDIAKLRYWLLVDELAEQRDDGGRAGWWRVTPLGARFVRVETRVLSHAYVYDSRCLGLVGEPVTIRDCLGNRFDYGELMADTPDTPGSAAFERRGGT